MNELERIEDRLCTPEERSFFRRLFDEVRRPEFAHADLSTDQLDALLDSQYSARQVQYDKMFEGAEYRVYLLDGELLGGYIIREVEYLHLIDITTLEAFRNHGYGAEIMRRILSAGQKLGKDVLLHVEHFNPARRLYERIGFVEVAEYGIYHRMIWSPKSASGA